MKRNQLVCSYINSVYPMVAACRLWWAMKYWLCRLCWLINAVDTATTNYIYYCNCTVSVCSLCSTMARLSVCMHVCIHWLSRWVGVFSRSISASMHKMLNYFNRSLSTLFYDFHLLFLLFNAKINSIKSLRVPFSVVVSSMHLYCWCCYSNFWNAFGQFLFFPLGYHI